MANQWALLIGINQYKALQPLMYAQADAIALRNFFVDELGIPVDHCTLLTDMSAAIEPHAYMPLRREIETQLQTLCREKVQPGDLLWVFFSGYGLAEGGKDYWLTLDADPMNLSGTGIAVSEIFDLLSQARTDQIFLVMDMNRSQGAVGHRNIGAQSLTLAKDFGLPLFLSCQPDQFAHETMYLRHGLFTQALLEGLRYHGCITASQLAAYVSDRLPELCQHHCRPPQTPVTVIPPAQKFMMVVPAAGLANLSVTESAAANLAALPTPVESPEAGVEGLQPDLITQPIAPLPPLPGTGTVGSDIAPGRPVVPPDSSLATRPPDQAPPMGAMVPKPEPEEPTTWGWLWKWGGLAMALAFLAGVLLRYQPVLLGGNRGGEPEATTEVESAAAPTPAAAGTEPPATAPTNSEGAPAEGESAASGDALFPAAIDPVQAGESALQRAEAAIAAQRYGEARAWLSQVPPELQNDNYQALLQQANSAVAEAAVRNQSILDEARQIIQPASASRFNDAIEQARQIPPEDPYYEQAQADIARWSQVILDLAEGRAASGQINQAIAAARLVPEDQPAISALAKQRIAAWEKQVANQQLIQQTQNTLVPGQASSFNNAIRALTQIAPDQPGYPIAQERINQWSQDILAIARARAARGDLPGAIAAATLVPPGTGSYEPAQQEIQRWRGQQ